MAEFYAGLSLHVSEMSSGAFGGGGWQPPRSRERKSRRIVRRYYCIILQRRSFSTLGVFQHTDVA